jgi:diacylglycerol kinase (ATP)
MREYPKAGVTTDYADAKKKAKSGDPRLYNKNFIQSCANAMNGIVYCTISQANLRKELVLGALALILSLFYNFNTAEFLCLMFAMFFVIFAEFVNTALETLVDLYVDVYHPKAKIVKDIGAGAVVFTCINAVIVAYFLFFRETQIAEISQSLLSAMVHSNSHLTFVALGLTLIVIALCKMFAAKKKEKNPLAHTFNPSGQTALAFAILTAIWMNSRSPIVFCLALILSFMVLGNRINDTRTFGETIFGVCMGVLIVFLVYGLTAFAMMPV